jgi:hypothetical protein
MNLRPGEHAPLTQPFVSSASCSSTCGSHIARLSRSELHMPTGAVSEVHAFRRVLSGPTCGGNRDHYARDGARGRQVRANASDERPLICDSDGERRGGLTWNPALETVLVGDGVTILTSQPALGLRPPPCPSTHEQRPRRDKQHRRRFWNWSLRETCRQSSKQELGISGIRVLESRPVGSLERQNGEVIDNRFRRARLECISNQRAFRQGKTRAECQTN